MLLAKLLVGSFIADCFMPSVLQIFGTGFACSRSQI